VRRATFAGGSRDGERVVFASTAPASLVLDGEAYLLQGAGQQARYVLEERLSYLMELEDRIEELEDKAARLGVLDHPAVRGGRSTPGPRLH
jgi:hypothetical protein